MEERLAVEIQRIEEKLSTLTVKAGQLPPGLSKYTLLLEIRKGVEVFSPSPACTSNACYIEVELSDQRKVTQVAPILFLPKWYDIICYDDNEPLS